MKWKSCDTNKIRAKFDSFIYGRHEQSLKHEDLEAFLSENNLETLSDRSFNKKITLLRVKVNNEKKIAEEKAIRALKNISKVK